MSRRFWPHHACGHAATARSRIVFDGSGTIDRSVTVNRRPSPWHDGHAPSGVFGENDSAYSIGAPRGYVPAREYSILIRFDSVVTLPTDDRVVLAPRCCWSATAGGSPSISSTSGTGS